MNRQEHVKNTTRIHKSYNSYFIPNLCLLYTNNIDSYSVLQRIEKPK
jgi:hypothetical protein